eukprot:1423338-Pyramimonas_sp.AAC.2
MAKSLAITACCPSSPLIPTPTSATCGQATRGRIRGRNRGEMWAPAGPRGAPGGVLRREFLTFQA